MPKPEDLYGSIMITPSGWRDAGKFERVLRQGLENLERDLRRARQNKLERLAKG